METNSQTMIHRLILMKNFSTYQMYEDLVSMTRLFKTTLITLEQS